MSAPAIRATYTPPGPIAEAFLTSPEFVTGVMGPIGSGKTTACIVKGLMISGKQPKNAQGKRRSRGAIVRNTYPELRTTTIKSWHEWVPPNVGRWQQEGPPTHFVEGPDGLDMEVMFLALDRPEDVRKLLSLELTWAWINEAREVPKAILDGLTGRVGRFPPVRDGGCVSPQIFMDTNPPDNDHWWYRLAEEDHPDGFAFFRQPGGRSEHAENLSNLPQGYYTRAVAGKSPDWVKVYVDGEYGFVRDGRPVYPEYVDSLHCAPFELDPKLPLDVGLDFGLTPAATIGQRTRSGQWRTRHELVTQDMGVTRFAEELGRVLREQFDGWQIRVTGDPAGSARDHSERTAFDILKANQVIAKPATTNDFTPRRDAVGAAMSRLIDGQPGYVVHPDCRVLRKALQGGYCLRRIAIVGQERYKDAPDKNEYSHVAEANQYQLLGGGEGKKIVGRAPVEGRRPTHATAEYNLFGA